MPYDLDKALANRKPPGFPQAPLFTARCAIVALLVLGALALMIGSAAASAEAAKAPGPVILSARISVAHGQTLPASGARLVVTIHVRNATSCSFFRQHVPFSSLYLVGTVSCASGFAGVTMPPIANPYKKKVRLTYIVRVRGSNSRSAQRSVTVSEAAAAMREPGLPVAPTPAPTSAPTLAPTPSLQILSVSASPSVVPVSGGMVTVTVRAQSAITCTFSGDGLTTLPAPCGSGSAGMTVTYVANSGPTVVHTYYVVASDASGATTPSASFTVTQLGSPLPPSLLGYLDVCSPGPDCFYGPIYASYSNYGNVAPDGLGDCTFAAAANWQQIVHGATPDPAVVGYEFGTAGGTAAGGLSRNAFFNYWIQQGIAGIRATGFNSYFTDKTNVENGVQSYGAMLVELQFVAGTGFAQYTIPTAALHMAVVDGFTPEGPLVVTWGQTLQMSWAQWTAEVTGMWGVATS